MLLAFTKSENFHGKSLLIQITDLPLYKINKTVNQVSFNSVVLRNKNKLRVGPVGSCPGRQTIRGEDVTEIIENKVLVNSGFHTRNFSENYLQYAQVISKFRQSCPRPKNVSRRHIISLPRAPTLALFRTLHIVHVFSNNLLKLNLFLLSHVKEGNFLRNSSI